MVLLLSVRFAGGPVQTHILKLTNNAETLSYTGPDILRTLHRRPDMFAKLRLPDKTRAEKKFLAELEEEDDAFKNRNAEKLD